MENASVNVLDARRQPTRGAVNTHPRSEAVGTTGKAPQARVSQDADDAQDSPVGSPCLLMACPP